MRKLAACGFREWAPCPEKTHGKAAGLVTGSSRAQKRNEAAEKPPRSYTSVPVWPSGDWLPPGRIERAMQIGGWFGLAGHSIPQDRVNKHQARAVQKLAAQPEAPPAFLASVLPV